MFWKPAVKRTINPRYRAYGRARIDIAQRAVNPGDWERLWKQPQQKFPFAWGRYWKQCIEYKVDDFAAEVGFFIDVLGLPVNAFTPQYAMFTSPGTDFYFAVVPAPEGETSTPAEAFRLQFMVEDLFGTIKELERRSIHFDQTAQALSPNSDQWIASFHTPHGICVELWGLVETRAQPGVVDRQDGQMADTHESQPVEEVHGMSARSTSLSPNRAVTSRGNGNPVLPTTLRRQNRTGSEKPGGQEKDEVSGLSGSQPEPMLDLSWGKSRTYSFSGFQDDEISTTTGQETVSALEADEPQVVDKYPEMRSESGSMPRASLPRKVSHQRSDSTGLDSAPKRSTGTAPGMNSNDPDEPADPEVESNPQGQLSLSPNPHALRGSLPGFSPEKPIDRAGQLSTSETGRAGDSLPEDSGAELETESEPVLEDDDDEDLDFEYEYEYVDAETDPEQEHIHRKDSNGNQRISRLS